MNKKQTIVKKSLSKKYSNKPLSIAYYNSNDKNYFIKDSALVNTQDEQIGNDVLLMIEILEKYIPNTAQKSILKGYYNDF
ncbi:hypothetical protein RGC41_07605 [Helicobacter pylori]|uniref:hypothetical protein n=1 Tax=Helicobacter pylori TaxID=210 RepID=UPI0029285113|nr:hypothetical protein [Helicobacter pylori]MDU9804423.1 hypothetical protein [Helicobacter pylori]